MSWSPDGYSLLCASLDGTIACLTFSADELGAAASEHEVEAALQRTYGAAARRGRGAPGGGLLEDPSLLSYAARGADAAAAARAAAAQQAALAAAAAARAGGPGALAPLPAGSPQREFRGADGRRRIVPVALADGAPAGPLPPMPPPLLAPPPPSLGRSPLGLAPPTTSQQAPATAPAQQAGPPHAQQALGFPSPAGGAPGGGDGTPRRVAPVPVVPAPAPAPAPAPQMALALSRPTGGGAPSVKRKAPEPQTAPPPRAITTTAAAPSPAPQPAAPPPGLPLPPLQSALSAQLVPADAASGTAATVLEARNGGGALGAAALSCTRGGAVLWSDRLGAPVVALAGNAQFAAAATADGSLQVYTPAGRRALPALALGAPAVHLAAQGLRLAAVAASGTLWVWQLSPGLAGGADGQGGSCVLRASVLPALTPSAGLAALRMAACGAPLAVRTDGAALLYSTALQAWARVADASFLRSDFASAAPATAAGDGELAALGAAAARGALRGAGASAAAAMLLGAPGGGGGPGAAAEARALTGRHLEALLAGAGALRSAPELRRYLPLYAAHLARATADAPQPDARLRELLTELLGPLRWREVADQPDALGPGGWAPRLLGVRKRQLLTEDVLPAVAAARGAQRLAAEFAELAAELEEPGPAEE
jgi:protein HIRA/HIR1